MVGGKAPLLQVEDLGVHYRHIKALISVNIQVETGECIGVIGANGSGKTTLLRAIAGLVPAHEGLIRLSGERIDGLPAHLRARRGVAFAPDRGRVAPELTVEENLRTGALLCKDPVESQRRLRYVLDVFPDLEEMLGRRAGNLSGGQRQMVVLGRALMTAPLLLLADEPFTSLSTAVEEKAVAWLNRLKKTGLGIILAEHQLASVLRVADTIYALREGRVIYRGSSEDFRQTRPLGLIYFGE